MDYKPSRTLSLLILFCEPMKHAHILPILWLFILPCVSEFSSEIIAPLPQYLPNCLFECRPAGNKLSNKCPISSSKYISDGHKSVNCQVFFFQLHSIIPLTPLPSLRSQLFIIISPSKTMCVSQFSWVQDFFFISIAGNATIM